MQMEYRLLAILPAVDHGAKTCIGYPELLGEVCSRTLQPPQHIDVLIRNLGEGRDMLAWDDQHVNRGLRLNILKGKNMLILEHDLAWDLLAGNFTKKAVFCPHGELPPATGSDVCALSFGIEVRVPSES